MNSKKKSDQMKVSLIQAVAVLIGILILFASYLTLLALCFSLIKDWW